MSAPETINMAVISMPPAQRAAAVLKSDKAAAELTALAESSKSITVITNPAGRAECHAAAMKAKAARVAVEKAGKEARDDANNFSKAVIAEVSRLAGIISPEETRLLSLRDDYDAKIEAEKEAQRRAEQERIAAITRKIDAIRNMPIGLVGKTAAEIREAIQTAKAIEIDDGFGEQFGAAKEARGDAILKLIEMADDAERREEEAARAAEERRIAAEREAQERAEREAEAARVKEEAARLKAESDRLKAEREEFERQRAAEEEKRLDEARKAQEKAEREAAEQARKNAEASANNQTQFEQPAVSQVVHVAPATQPATQQTAVADTGARLKLGEMCGMLGFTVTAEFLQQIGFPPAAVDKNARLYRAADFPAICAAIARHAMSVGNSFSQKAA